MEEGGGFGDVELHRTAELADAAFILELLVTKVALPPADRVALLLAVSAADLGGVERCFLLPARWPLAGDGHHQAAFEFDLRSVNGVFGVVSLLLPVRGSIMLNPVRRPMKLAVEDVDSVLHPLLEFQQRDAKSLDGVGRADLGGGRHGLNDE